VLIRPNSTRFTPNTLSAAPSSTSASPPSCKCCTTRPARPGSTTQTACPRPRLEQRLDHGHRQDQGRSGASAIDREASSLFSSKLASAVLGPSSVWRLLAGSFLQRLVSLLEICAVTHTLVIDEDGVYDPSQYQDRLLLGIMVPCARPSSTGCATASSRQAREAEHGALRFRPPAVWFRSRP